MGVIMRPSAKTTRSPGSPPGRSWRAKSPRACRSPCAAMTGSRLRQRWSAYCPRSHPS